MCAHAQLFTWVVGHLNSVPVCTIAVTYRVILSSPTFSFILDFRACSAEVKLKEVQFFRINRRGVCSPSRFLSHTLSFFFGPLKAKAAPVYWSL